MRIMRTFLDSVCGNYIISIIKAYILLHLPNKVSPGGGGGAPQPDLKGTEVMQADTPGWGGEDSHGK